ncbi:MAG TPA: PQQ-dependent sugar dehydrogenase [Solirubrobacteraceae bacterium]
MSKPARVIAPVLALALAACGAGSPARSERLSVSAGRSTAGRSASSSARVRDGLRLVKVGSFREPVYVAGTPGDASRLFVVQRGGQVMLIHNGRAQAHPFLDISGKVNAGGQEQGLLGLAFAPDYARSGRFYLDYTLPSNDIRVVQYRRLARNPDLADPASARVVLTIDHHAHTNHNGGQLAFGPEGELYIGVGDGGSEGDPEGNGQNTNTLLGKILRISPSAVGGYTIPSSNPFAGQAGRRGEIWAYGLRNPWRFSFDRATGALIVGDVGQELEEEIDFVPAHTGAGANYGWSVWEGDRRNKPGTAPQAVFPVLIAKHSDGYCAIVGGFVVRDRSLPGLYGRYLFGDNCRAPIESVKLARGRAAGRRATGLNVSSTSSFGQDARGRIYVCSLGGGVYRLVGG